MTVSIIRGNARQLPLADNTVDLVVTSPPYFALRSYQDGGEHYAGQIGSEPTPAEFIDALLEVTRECVRVLKPSGSIFVNLGDKYATYAGNRSKGRSSLQGSTDRCRPSVPRKNGLDGGGEIRAKSLMLLPERYRIRCIDELGLIARAVIVWSKPNGLPESVTDRVRRSHEDWVHLTVQPRYYSAVDEIREAHGSTAWIGRAKQERFNTDRNDGGGVCSTANPLGKLPGSVWTIPTEPLIVPPELGVDHFAAYPTEWPRRIIAGWSPREVCTACGEGRRPVSIGEHERPAGGWKPDRSADAGANRPVGLARPSSLITITGYACACTPFHMEFLPRARDQVKVYDWHLWTPAPTTPGVVVDPFGGTGTTALVADVLGRHGISVDMSADYCRLAEWRTSDPGQRAKAARVEKPPVQVAGQLDLFEMGAGA